MGPAKSASGPVVDSDATANFVNENSAVGTIVGVTAFADDLDATDSVSYGLDDNAGGRFAIDSLSGVVTVSGGEDFRIMVGKLPEGRYLMVSQSLRLSAATIYQLVAIEAVVTQETNHGLRIDIVLVVHRFHGLGLDQVSALEPD